MPGAMLTALLASTLSACSSRSPTPVAARATAAVPAGPAVIVAADTTPAPVVHAAGRDYAAIARSLTDYRTWLLAHHPDASLASTIYAHGTIAYERAQADLDALHQRHQTIVAIGRRVTFVPVTARPTLVTLRMHEVVAQTNVVDRAGRVVSSRLFRAPNDYVVAMTRGSAGAWRLADITRVSRDAIVASDGSGSGTLGGTPPQLGVGLLVSVPAISGGGHDTYTADDPSAPRPVYERAIPSSNGDGGAGALSNLCTTPDGPQGPEWILGNGWTFYLELFSTADGRLLTTLDATLCEPLDPAARTVAPPPPEVVQPPTIGEIWRSVDIPGPTIGTNPAARGITGLPTWVWTTGAAAPVAISANLRGYAITGTARIAGYAVYPGTGGWVRTRTAGRADRPAVAHTYEKTGTYRLGVATLWTAAAVFTVPGIARPFSIDLGTAVVTNGRDYPVVQIRSRLQP